MGQGLRGHPETINGDHGRGWKGNHDHDERQPQDGEPRVESRPEGQNHQGNDELNEEKNLGHANTIKAPGVDFIIQVGNITNFVIRKCGIHLCILHFCN